MHRNITPTLTNNLLKNQIPVLVKPRLLAHTDIPLPSPISSGLTELPFNGVDIPPFRKEAKYRPGEEPEEGEVEDEAHPGVTPPVYEVRGVDVDGLLLDGEGYVDVAAVVC